MKTISNYKLKCSNEYSSTSEHRPSSIYSFATSQNRKRYCNLQTTFPEVLGYHSKLYSESLNPYKKRLRFDFKIFSSVNKKINRTLPYRKEVYSNESEQFKTNKKLADSPARFFSIDKIGSLIKGKAHKKYKVLKSDIRLLKEISTETNKEGLEVAKTYVKIMENLYRSNYEIYDEKNE